MPTASVPEARDAENDNSIAPKIMQQHKKLLRNLQNICGIHSVII